MDKQEEFVAPKNKGGRPRVHVPKTGVTKETRVPIDGSRDILTVSNQDPRYHYHWEYCENDSGYRIQKLRLAGYEFVQANKQETVGQPHVYQSASHGSLIRVPSGANGHVYLMRIPKEWRNDDLKALEEKNKTLEQSLTTTGEGQYLKKFEITRN
jgi:hypothetical protein